MITLCEPDPFVIPQMAELRVFVTDAGLICMEQGDQRITFIRQAADDLAGFLLDVHGRIYEA